MGVKPTSLPGGDLTSKQAGAPTAESSSGSKITGTTGMSVKSTEISVVTYFVSIISVVHIF